MKRLSLIIFALLTCSILAEAQRPAGQAVSGCTSSTSSPSCVAILVDSNGVVSGSVTLASVTTSGVTGGMPTTIVGCSSSVCYSTPVMGSAITVSTTTVAPFGTTTTLVQGLHLNNITNGAVTVTITDGNNVPFVGTTTFGTSYSIPAVSNLDINMGLMGHVFTSGLNISTATANAIRMWVEGKQ